MSLVLALAALGCVSQGRADAASVGVATVTAEVIYGIPERVLERGDPTGSWTHRGNGLSWSGEVDVTLAATDEAADLCDGPCAGPAYALTVAFTDVLVDGYHAPCDPVEQAFDDYVLAGGVDGTAAPTTVPTDEEEGVVAEVAGTVSDGRGELDAELRVAASAGGSVDGYWAEVEVTGTVEGRDAAWSCASSS